MKAKLVALLTIFVALVGAPISRAQIRIQPPPPLPVTPITPIYPSVRPIPVPIAPLPPPPFNPPPSVYVAPIPIAPAPPPAGGNAPPINVEQAYVIAVCANASDVSTQCLQQSAAEAAEKLSRMYMRQWAKRVLLHNLSIRFPKTISPMDQFRFLTRIEKTAIAAIQAKIQADIESLRPFEGDTAATKAAKWESVRKDRIAVNNWARNATSAAESNSNWSHDWSSNTHRFNEGNAFRQLKQISISGWGGN